MAPLKLPPTSRVYPLVLRRRADELAALLNQQGDTFKVTVGEGEGAAAWNTQSSGENFVIVSNADGVRLTANEGEVTSRDVGASVLLSSRRPDEHDEKHLWAFLTET